ncbi:MAG: hypothetical protein ACREPK_03980 [Rhodanobacteraceae bacterium]
MDVLERAGRKPEPGIHWLVRGVMWLLVALCVALACSIALAPWLLNPAASTPAETVWAVLPAAGVCGCCVLGAGFLGTLAWRGDSAIRRVVWTGGRPVAPRLPWYTRTWAGIVCAGTLMLGIAQVHQSVVGDAAWLSALVALVTVAIAFQHLALPLSTGRWSRTTLRLATHLTMTPREIRATVKRSDDRRHGI